MRNPLPLLAAALLAAACSSPGGPEPRSAAPTAESGPAPAAPAETAAPTGSVVVEMRLVEGLGAVARNPQTLRRKLDQAPPEGLAAGGLPPGDWAFGRAPLTRTHAIAFALSADRKVLWFDANHDGAFSPDERHENGRRIGRMIWHEQLPTTTRREQDGVVAEAPIFMAIGGQPNGLMAFSRLDAHRSGRLEVDGEELAIAVVDTTFRGWFEHRSRDRMLVDVDGNGRFDTSEESHERYFLGEPIPFGDRNLRITTIEDFGAKLTFEPSDKPARRMAPLHTGGQAPELAGFDLDGNEVRLSAHRGSWVFVDFWATWCGPCLRELPHLKALKQAHPELVILGVSGDRQRQALVGFLERDPLPWPQIYDEDAPIRREWRVRSLPTSYLIAPDGTIATKNLRGAGMKLRYELELERWAREQARAAAGG